MKPCPCGNPLDYQDCCQPLHSHTRVAETAEQLMRSRYCAFVLKLADYLIATHKPEASTPHEMEQLQETFDSTQWLGLRIINRRQGTKADAEGWVEFTATYQTVDGQGQLHENSRFIQEDGRWLYVAGELSESAKSKRSHQTPIKTGRNEPCWCGSGKKTKKCHR